MVTFTINIPQMLASIPYMDRMGINIYIYEYSLLVGADQALLMDILPSGNLTVLLKMTIEIVDLFNSYVSLPEGNYGITMGFYLR